MGDEVEWMLSDREEADEALHRSIAADRHAMATVLLRDLLRDEVPGCDGWLEP